MSVNPLVLITNQCRHRRELSAAMEQLASRLDVDDEAIRTVIDWLKGGLPMEFRDTADDLLPMLRARARRDDDFTAVMATLEADYTFSIAHIRRLLPRLEALRQANQPVSMDSAAVQGLTDLALRERQHVALLTKVILPIARLRLTKEDLAVLSRHMAARRETFTGNIN